MKKLLIPILCTLFLFCWMNSKVQAQVLDSENKVGITLSDGTQVICYGKYNTVSSGKRGQKSNEYYYLPANLRLSARPDGTPEFLFVKYTTEETIAAGGVQGALMHFLMEWGLTPAQEKELQQKIKQKAPAIRSRLAHARFAKKNADPIVKGPATMKSDVQGETFRIISGTLTNDEFTPNLVTTGRAPICPGSKIAVAAIMDKNGAQLLASTFEKTRSITDVSLDLRFQYEVMTPAVEGKITVKWDEIYKFYQNYKRDYSHTDEDDGTMPKYNSLKDDIISDTERDSLFESFESNKWVDIQLDQLKPDNPVAKEVTEAFMEYFLASVSEKEYFAPQENVPREPLKPADPYQPDENLYQYHIDLTRIEAKSRKGSETYKLSLSIPMVMDHSLTENLASWYDGVKHNKRCVTSVNLNDPFFQHRQIHLILDGEAEQMVGDEVNAVSVDIRKKRSAGHDFQDAIMIDRNTLSQGTLASLTYARGDDKNPDVYEYRTSWNLKGRIFPENPEWQEGDWKGINLVAPVAPRTIMFEGDLNELAEMGIPRATLQVRYQKFGKEVETNIPITVSQGIPLVEKTIYTDKDTRGYVSRLILTHKRNGKLVLPWESKINDDYVYAIIPEEINDTESDVFSQAVALGKEVKRVVDGDVSAADQVLDKFKEIFDTIKKD